MAELEYLKLYIIQRETALARFPLPTILISIRSVSGQFIYQTPQVHLLITTTCRKFSTGHEFHLRTRYLNRPVVVCSHQPVFHERFTQGRN